MPEWVLSPSVARLYWIKTASVFRLDQLHRYMVGRTGGKDLGVHAWRPLPSATPPILYEIPQTPEGFKVSGGVVVLGWLLVAITASVSAALGIWFAVCSLAWWL